MSDTENIIKELVAKNDKMREAYLKIENEIFSHGPEGRNYTNQQYVDLLQKFESQQAEIDKLNMFREDYRKTALERIAYQEQQIESKKEEIEKLVDEVKFQVERNDRQREEYFATEKLYFDQKAITELAVKGLKEAELNYLGRASYESPNNTIQEMLKPIRSTLSEIEKLQNE